MSSSGTATGPALTVTVEIDQRVGSKVLVFNRNISTQDASTFLWGNPRNASLLKPLTPLGATARKFSLETHDVATVMSMRSEVRDAIIVGGVIRSAGTPYNFPQWVPENVRDDIQSGRLAKGIRRYPGPPEWGNIVVWTGNASVQLYVEFPPNLVFYTRMAHDEQQARLLHAAYTQYNKDMYYFVETKGFSPEEARDELRRINEEVFKLIIEGAVAILTSGVGISQVNNAIRFNSEEISNAARRSPRLSNLPGVGKIRPVGGRVNVGGGFETPHYSNLNPIKPGSGPQMGIPNLVKGGMEDMDRVFEAGSVQEMISSKLRFVDVNWDVATRAAARAMRPGGKVEMNVWCEVSEAQALKTAFERAGFRNVSVSGQGVGTMLRAIR
jgi:hypothetical protein